MKRFEYIIALIIFLLYVLGTKCAVTQVMTTPKNTAVKVVSNKHVQWYGSSLCMMGFACMNAVDNALIFGKPGSTHYVQFEGWHAWKNGALVCLGSGLFLKGLGVGQGHFTMRQVGTHFIKREAPLMWEGWQNTYDLIRYDKVFDYRKEYNEHRIVIPSFWGDSYHPDWMNKPVVWGTIDGALILYGSGLMDDCYRLIKWW